MQKTKKGYQMKNTKWIIIAGIVVFGSGLVLACSDMRYTCFPNGSDCTASPCAYDEVDPDCGYCGFYSPGDNCVPIPGTEYSAVVTHYVGGVCLSGFCQDGDPDPNENPFTIQCYNFEAPY